MKIKNFQRIRLANSEFRFNNGTDNPPFLEMNLSWITEGSNIRAVFLGNPKDSVSIANLNPV